MQDKYLSAKIIIFLIHVDPEDGDGTFLWYIHTYLSDNMLSHSRRQYI